MRVLAAGGEIKDESSAPRVLLLASAILHHQAQGPQDRKCMAIAGICRKRGKRPLS